MQNPFKPDVIPYGKDFIGRDQELKELEQKILSSNNQRMLLLAPRRFGKTTLLLNLIDILRKHKHCCVYVDIFSTTSIDDFANLLLDSIVKSQALNNIQKVSKWIKDNLLNLRANFKLSTNYQGDISLEPMVFKSFETALKKIEEALLDLESLGKKQPVLLVIDEFQTILEWDKDQKLERQLRTIIQRFKNLNIIFSGSQVSLLQQIFTSADRPFFKQVRTINLESISDTILRPWINKSFLKSQIKIAEDVIDAILSLTNLNPQQIQNICYELWNKTTLEQQKNISLDYYNEFLDLLIYKETNNNETLWLQLNSSQKKFLKALAKIEKVNNPQGKEFARLCSLATSTIQSLIPKLELQYIIVHHNQSYYINDGIFRLWINKNSG